MIFLSAQPDEYYFLWQLELQVFNLNKLGIPASDIHVLIGYNPDKGLQEDFVKLCSENTFCQIYPYPDLRSCKEYAPSIRPHIIVQHFRQFPNLLKERIFYTDSDVIFIDLPKFDLLNTQMGWYVSNTKSYIDSNYLITNIGLDGLNEMSNLIGIPSSLVIENDINAGGAQYFFSNTSITFWEKVEEDCYKLYKCLCKYEKLDIECHYKKTGSFKKSNIQAWCSDMWSILWNAWLSEIKVFIHQELDFIWTSEYIGLGKKKILHYSGDISEIETSVFRKNNFIHYPPYYEDFSLIDMSKGSKYIVEIIYQYREFKYSSRANLEDVSYCVYIDKVDEEVLDKLYVLRRYLDKHFYINLLVMVYDEINLMESFTKHYDIINLSRLSSEDAQSLFMKRCKNIMIFTYIDVVLSAEVLIQSVMNIKINDQKHLLLTTDNLYNVDIVFRSIFNKILNYDVLLSNLNKFKVFENFCCAFLGINSAITNNPMQLWSNLKNSAVLLQDDLDKPSCSINIEHAFRFT